MATSTTELILKFSGDPRNLKETLTQVRGDLTNLSKAQVSVARETNKNVASEAKTQTNNLNQEERARASAALALQRQRSAALIGIWKAEAREKARLDKETEEANKKASQLFSLEGLTSNIPILKNFTAQFSTLSTEGAGAASVLVGVAGAIGIVVAGAAIGIAALAKLGSEIFDLTKKTAEFQGKFFDLSQQVGVSVETLSTLDVIASTTGGNIDTVTASLAIFQKHLEASHDPTSKEAKLLKELGVTSLDTETALRQAIKGLFNLGEGSKQTDAALELFGRSGRFVNAIMKESKGDLDAAAKAFGGLLISREAAAAADSFNDNLEILNRTLARVSANLLSEAIPVFTVFFEDLNKALTGNAEDWGFWADAIKVEVAGVLGTLQGLAIFLASGGLINPFTAIDASIRSLLQRAEQESNKRRFEGDVERIQRLTQSVLAGKPGDTPNASKANSEAQTRAASEIASQQRFLEEGTRVHREKLERERERDLKSIDEWETESIKAAGDHWLAQAEIFNKESVNVQKYVKNREDARLAEQDIELKRIKSTNETAAAIQKIQDDAQKKRDQSELTLNQQLLKVRDAQRAAEVQDIKQEQDQEIISESTAILRRMVLLKQEFDDRKVLRDLELSQASTSAERQIQIANEKVEAETNYTREYKRLTQERIDALQEEARKVAENTESTQIKFPEQSPGEVLTLPPPPDISLWEEAISHLRSMLEDFSTFATGTVRFAIDSLADGLGDAARAWVLYGASIGQALKRALAETLASIAAQALIQAALHAAYAIGDAAFGNWAAAAQHAIAAAKFLGVAALAGLAGRAIAGNSFSGGGGSSAFSGSNSSSSRPSTSTNSGQPKTVEIDRATTNQNAIVRELTFKVKGDAVIDSFIEDFDLNGRTRVKIMSER